LRRWDDTCVGITVCFRNAQLGKALPCKDNLVAAKGGRLSPFVLGQQY